jgi:hypothetical protein
MPAKKFICLLPKHADVRFDTSLTSALWRLWRTHHATCVPAMRMTAPNPENPQKAANWRLLGRLLVRIRLSARA